MDLKRHIRFFVIITIFVNYATSKNVSGVNQLLRSQNIDAPHLNDQIGGSFHVPADSTTIWLEDFESDISDWRIENGWELTQESSHSPTHSFHMDDNNYGISASIISPIISLPSLSEDNEILKFNDVSNLPFFNEALKLVIEEPPQFSLAAWHMGGEGDYCKRVLNICYEKCVLKKKRLRKLRGIIRTIALVKRIYDDTLERYYMPGGRFVTNAACIWNPIMKIDSKVGFVKKIKQDVYLNRV